MRTRLAGVLRSGTARASTAAVALFGAILAVGVPSAAPASAAPGEGHPLLQEKTGEPAVAAGGELIHYAINYSCSNSESDDGCDGSVFIDPIPKFTNIYGELVPLEFVSVSTNDVWPDLHLDASDPDNPVVTGVAAAWAPGGSGAIFITLRVPLGEVPANNPQSVTNVASVDDPETPATDPDDFSTVATTVIDADPPNWVISKIGPTTGTRMNRDYEWVVSVCNDDEPPSALWPVFDITDTLPAGFQFVDAENGGVFTDDGSPDDGISDGAATITWHFDQTNRPPLTEDGCFRMTVTGRFPSGYTDPNTTDPANDDNVAGAVKTNVATGVGQEPDGTPSQDLGTAPWDTTLVGPTFGSAGGDKRFSDLAGADNFYTTTGDEGRFNLSAGIDSDFPIDRLTLSDGTWRFGNDPTVNAGMPDSFTPTSVNPGTWNAPIPATLEYSIDGSTGWTPFATVNSGDAAVAVPAGARSVRWVWGDGGDDVVPGNFSASGQQIIGSVGAPSNVFGLYTNTATVTAERDATVLGTDVNDDQYVFEPALPLPMIDKQVSDSERRPGQTATYTITIGNSPDATGPLVNPVVTDCIPNHFILEGAVTVPAPFSAGPTPTCAAGETPLGFTYNGTLDPGDTSAAITYTVSVATETPGPIAPAGDYLNTAFIRPSVAGSYTHCTNTDPSCGDTAVVVVPPIVELESRKCVTGSLDNGEYRPSPACGGTGTVVSAQTLPGGMIGYRLQLQNTGNTDATNIEFIDIFPHEGDTAVISGGAGGLNQRFTEYTPFLVSPIVPPTGWTVEYSLSANPCRPEVGGPATGCDAPDWFSSSPTPYELPAVRSVRFTYSGVLGIGETATFEWTMRAPVTDDTFDVGGTNAIDPYEFLHDCDATAPRTDPTHCPRAVNSFAYGADAANLPVGVPVPARLFAEPPQVEVRVSSPPPPNGIGDRVWFDDDFDGIQDAGEAGIAGVYIQLWKVNPDGSSSFAFDTYTDVNGNYFFSGEAAGLSGDYFVRFYPPTGWYVSPQDQTGTATDDGGPELYITGPIDPNFPPGTNTDDDSDVPRSPTGIDPARNNLGYHDTTVITIGDNFNVIDPGIDEDPDMDYAEVDRTWDMGLWYPQPAIEVVKVTRDTAWPSGDGDGVTILRGRPVTWTYTVTNTGNSRLENVSLTDNGGPDPDFAVSNCAIVDDGANADGLTSSATAPIALNRGAVMSCTATGTAGNVNYSNVATVTGEPRTDSGQPVPDDPSFYPPVPDSVSDTDPSSYVAGKYDLALAKTASTPNLATGTVTFTLTVRNEGNFNSGTYQVTDVLPAGLSVAGSNPAATQTPGAGGTTILTWTRSNLAPGSNHTFTIDAHIDDYLARPFRNYAEISDDGADQLTTGPNFPTPTTDWDSTPDADIANDNTAYGPIGTPDPAADNATIGEAGSSARPDAGDDPADGQDDADIADVNPTIAYDLALAKAVAVSPVPFGDDPVFSVRVYNQGNVPSGQVVVRDQLPDGLGFDAAGSTAGCVAAPVNQVLCTIDTIAPGSSVLLTIATTINTTVVDGQTIVDYSTAPWRNWAEIDSDSAAELYGITDGDSQPEGDETDGIGNGNTPPGDGYVGVPTAGTTYADPGVGDEDDNDDDVAATAVRYDLALAKVAAAPDLAAGTVAYTITVANQGTVPSGAYTIEDVLPAGQTLAAAPAPTPSAPTVNGSTLTWVLPSLAAGGQQTVTYTATITDYRLQPFTNVAEIVEDSATELYNIADADSATDDPESSAADNTDIGQAGGADDGGFDDEDIAVVPLAMRYDLAAIKVANVVSPPTQSAPARVEYTVTVANQGNVPSGSYTVVDTLPGGVTLVAGSISDGGTLSGTEITWAGADLAPGASKTFTFSVDLTDVTQRPFVNSVEITADSAQALYGVDDDDSVPGDPESSEVDNTLIAEAGVGADDDFDDEDIAVVDLPLGDTAYDLALIKTVDSPTVAFDGTITWTVTVVNQGVLESHEVTVSDPIPAGLALSGSPVASAGTIDTTTPGIIGWTIPNLVPGGTATLTITTTIADITQRPFRNQAEITADSADDYDVPGDDVHDADSSPDAAGDPANDGTADNTDITQAGGTGDESNDDADIADATVNVDYDLALLKLGPVTLDPSGLVTFTIRVQNQGNVPSGPYTVTDEIPDGMAFDSASDGGGVGGGGVRWVDLPSLAPGAEQELTVTFTITDYSQRPFTNFAEITADSSELYDAVDGPAVDDSDSTPNDDPTNGHDSTELIADDPDDGTYDDEDIAILDPEIRYDMEIVKTVQPAVVTAGGAATFTITVFNNGNVPSGPVTVTDVVPAGLTATAASNGGVVNGDGTVAWTVELPAQQTLVLTVDVTVSDITQRPFRNVAEITADGADLYDQEGIDVEDVDSAPDPDHDPNDDGPNDDTDISEATAETDGNDDADPAVLNGEVVYDLALIKRLPAGQRFKLGDVVRFEIVVGNQGNVPSGVYTVQDVLPAGLSFVAASDGGTAAAGTVTWSGLPSLAPGEQKLLTVDVRMDDVGQPSYVNVAEITDDSSETYSAPADPVTDVDSTPDGDPNNDPYADTDDISTTPAGDEDDHDRALIDPAEVAVDNLSPVPPTQPTSPPTTIPDPGELPRTGGDNTPIALIAGGLLLAGVALVLVRRRAPRQRV